MEGGEFAAQPEAVGMALLDDIVLVAPVAVVAVVAVPGMHCE